MKLSNVNALSTGALIGVMCLSAAPAMSENLSNLWQPDRETIGDLTERACYGDEQAYHDLYSAATDEKNPVAQNNIVWLNAHESCVFAGSNLPAAYDLQFEAANAGYPIAVNNVGHRYMTGKYIPRDSETAVAYFEYAIQAGYGTAALDLAEYYLTGEFVEQDYGRAVHYLRQARADKGVGDDYPDTDAIADLARRLDMLTAREAGFIAVEKQSKWTVLDNTASWKWVSNGRLQGEVSVVADVNTGDLFYNFYRESNDPIIHFMRASVEHANGTESELHFGKCGSTNCLETFYFDNNIQATDVSIPILPSQRAHTLEALKSGDTVTFRYQTRDSLALDKSANFTLSLKGSRKAIDQVERMSAMIANEYNRSNVDYSSPQPSVTSDDDIDDGDRSQIFTHTPGASGAINSGATGGPIVMSYDDAAIIDHAVRSAGGKFSKAPVTCFAVSSGASPAGIQRELNRLSERHQQVNAAVVAEPIGNLILQYIWGGVVVEHVYDNRTDEHYAIIDQRDHYTGTTECDPDNLEYATPEAAMNSVIAKTMSRESRSFDKRTVADWRERILRPEPM